MNRFLYRRYILFPFVLLPFIVVSGCSTQSADTSMTAASENNADDGGHAVIYSVAEYDPARDPAADLAETVKMASIDGKNIILVVGGNWCSWCRLLSDYVHNSEAVQQKLASNFVMMKVNMGDGNDNTEFLGQYPKAEGYPHLYVLSSDGEFIHSQGTGVLENGAGYDDAKFLAFLDQFSPTKQ